MCVVMNTHIFIDQTEKRTKQNKKLLVSIMINKIGGVILGVLVCVCAAIHKPTNFDCLITM